MSIEMHELSYKDSVKNLYNVPESQWRRWSSLARSVFNSLFSTMHNSPWAFVCPKHAVPSPRRWKVTCWNAAWIAADSVRAYAKKGPRKANKAIRKAVRELPTHDEIARRQKDARDWTGPNSLDG